MLSTVASTPDQPPCVLIVGQDAAGHWLVQDNRGCLEGRFISLSTAMAFARSEGHSLPGARIVRATMPLVPTISFAKVEPWETAEHWRHAA